MTAEPGPVRHLVVGPAEHGVVRHALSVSGTAQVLRPPIVDAATAVAALPRDGGVLHVPVTDHLLAVRTEDAAAWFAEVAGAAGGRALTVTLHDVPQPGDGPGRFSRRAATYRAIVAAADGVITNSEHETSLLDELSVPDGPRAVVPLPIDVVPGGARPASDGEVTVLGFVYPGKGHDEVLAAMTGMPEDVGVRALGRVADGHDDLLLALHAQALALGRRFEVTGFLADKELARAMRTAAVPIAPHRGISASGSIGTWLSAGRRPLVPNERYTRELAARCPGSVWRYPEGGLPDALARALAEPERTWLGSDVVVGPSTAEATARYAALLAGWSR